jgi:hypothetical protein
MSESHVEALLALAVVVVLLWMITDRGDPGLRVWLGFTAACCLLFAGWQAHDVVPLLLQLIVLVVALVLLGALLQRRAVRRRLEEAEEQDAKMTFGFGQF